MKKQDFIFIVLDLTLAEQSLGQGCFGGIRGTVKEIIGGDILETGFKVGKARRAGVDNAFKLC